MKKIVGVLVAFCVGAFLHPATADTVFNINQTVPNSCVVGVIGVSDNTANATANWSPNTYNCAAGTYLPAGNDWANDSQGCTQCPAGSYCAGGTFTYNESSAQGITGTCAVGTYSTAGASSCTACPTGYTSNAGATSCDICAAGYYSSNGQCVECQVNHYCPGDNQIYDCPAFTYTNLDDIRPMFSGYNVHSVGTVELGSNWLHHNYDMMNIGDCVLNMVDVDVDQGRVHVRSCKYSQQSGKYDICSQPNNAYFWWESANPGYYLSDSDEDVWWYSVKACTNAPSNAHYTGAGTPDSADGTVVDANDCPWVCDAGYWNDNGTCTECSANHYCPGDNIMYDCPAVTYNSTEELKSMITGYNVHSIEGAKLYSEIHRYGREMTNIETCTLNLYGVEVDEGSMGMYLLFYSQQTGTYSTFDLICWTDTNPGYYRYGHYFNNCYFNAGACTNAPSNAHYTGAGTPDVGNCPWECDAGYSTNVSNTACNANIINISWRDASGGLFESGSCTYDGAITTPTLEPVKKGYTFTGWTLSAQ